MSDRMELRLDLPRWQVRMAWVAFVAFEGLALYGLRLDSARGQLGLSGWLSFGVRAAQGVVVPWACFGMFATLLEVEEGRLRVRTRWNRVFRNPGIETPLAEVSLEWISHRLVMQRPQEGWIILLGSGTPAHRAADWLVAQGVRPPVGG